jgi:hypothetical protein
MVKCLDESLIHECRLARRDSFLVAVDSVKGLLRDGPCNICQRHHPIYLPVGLSNLPASSGSHPKHSRSVMGAGMRSDCESRLNEDERRKTPWSLGCDGDIHVCDYEHDHVNNNNR